MGDGTRGAEREALLGLSVRRRGSAVGSAQRSGCGRLVERRQRGVRLREPLEVPAEPITADRREICRGQTGAEIGRRRPRRQETLERSVVETSFLVALRSGELLEVFDPHPQEVVNGPRQPLLLPTGTPDRAHPLKKSVPVLMPVRLVPLASQSSRALRTVHEVHQVRTGTIDPAERSLQPFSERSQLVRFCTIFTLFLLFRHHTHPSTEVVLKEGPRLPERL